jgi:septal ring factor EnvC (AmiA/AmiB activator)
VSIYWIYISNFLSFFCVSSHLFFIRFQQLEDLRKNLDSLEKKREDRKKEEGALSKKLVSLQERQKHHVRTHLIILEYFAYIFLCL